jgi:hypothetical protein
MDFHWSVRILRPRFDDGGPARIVGGRFGRRSSERRALVKARELELTLWPGYDRLHPFHRVALRMHPLVSELAGSSGKVTLPYKFCRFEESRPGEFVDERSGIGRQHDEQRMQGSLNSAKSRVRLRCSVCTWCDFEHAGSLKPTQAHCDITYHHHHHRRKARFKAV